MNLGRASLAVFVASFSLSVCVFVAVQVLQSYPFHHLGVFGPQQLFFLTYSQTLELSSVISIIAYALWQFERSPLASTRSRIMFASGKTLLFVGVVVTVIIYAEIHLLWGELWYGVHLWAGLPGGGGYPWGDEQVAYNLCFVKDPSYSLQTPDCYLLNYNGLLALGVAALLLGGLLEIYRRSDRPAE